MSASAEQKSPRPHGVALTRRPSTVTYIATRAEARHALALCNDADLAVLSPPNHDRATWALEVFYRTEDAPAPAPQRSLFATIRDAATISGFFIISAIAIGVTQ